MKRSSQTEKKVFNSANGFEKRPAAKKNCADYGFCAAQIFIALTTAVSLSVSYTHLTLPTNSLV